MRQVSERLRRGTVLCLLGGVLLLVLVLTIGPPTAVAAERGENVSGEDVNGENVTVYRTPNATFENAGAIEGAIANGTLRPADKVAVGDTLVVAIQSERLSETMNTTNGSTTDASTTDASTVNDSTTARFFTALDGEAEFRIIQTNPTANANRKVALTGPSNVTVHRDGATVYAVVETGDLQFRYRRVHRPTQIYGGERFAVQFGYDLPDDWSRGTVPSSPIIELHPRSELTTERPQTTVSTHTTSETVTSTERPTSRTSTASRSLATSERGGTTRIGENQTGESGVPGFTVATALVALLVLAVRLTRRS